MKKIIINDKQIILDDEDYIYLSKFKWKIVKKGNDYYVVVKKMKGIGRRTVQLYLHEFLIELDNQDCIGFKNKNTLDNRKENLFGVSKGYNIARTRKRVTANGKKPTSKYKGVCQRIRKGITGYEVRITKDKKVNYVGYYKTEREGALAYNKKAEELYGEFAYKNNI